jgi:hypothetical protein
MSTAGLALAGFMDEPFAHQFLAQNCVGAGKTSADFHAAWVAAVAKRGAPVARAGHPDVKEVPKTHLKYLRAVERSDRFKSTVERTESGITRKLPYSFKMVEIEPVLAFQLSIGKSRSANACSALTSNPPSLDELLRTCLPTKAAKLDADVRPTPAGILIRTNDANVRILDARGAPGPEETFQMRVKIGTSSPLVWLAHWNGLYVVANGYHRLYGARQAGATHAPCLVVEVSDWTDFVAPTAQVFTQALLSSAEPPTMSHFDDSRAWPVELKGLDKLIQFSWSELLLPALP